MADEAATWSEINNRNLKLGLKDNGDGTYSFLGIAGGSPDEAATLAEIDSRGLKLFLEETATPGVYAFPISGGGGGGGDHADLTGLEDDDHPQYWSGGVTPSTPARVIDTPFQPSATRPRLVTYTARIDNGVGEIGVIELRSDAANPPTTVRASTRHPLVGVGEDVPLAWLVPAGHYVELAAVNEAGTPTFSIIEQAEAEYSGPNPAGASFDGPGIAAAGGLAVVAYKSVDEAVNNSDVLQDDDALFFAVGANEVWAVHLFVVAGKDAASPMYGWSGPAASAFEWYGYEDMEDWGGALAGQMLGYANALTTPVPTLPAKMQSRISGRYIGGANAGTLQLRWAQNPDDAGISDTTVFAGSYILAARLA